jgi:hypothetical protein
MIADLLAAGNTVRGIAGSLAARHRRSAERYARTRTPMTGIALIRRGGQRGSGRGGRASGCSMRCSGTRAG